MKSVQLRDGRKIQRRMKRLQNLWDPYIYFRTRNINTILFSTTWYIVKKLYGLILKQTLLYVGIYSRNLSFGKYMNIFGAGHPCSVVPAYSTSSMSSLEIKSKSPAIPTCPSWVCYASLVVHVPLLVRSHLIFAPFTGTHTLLAA